MLSAHQRSWARHAASTAIICSLIALAACGGGSGSSSSVSAQTYSLSATVSGLNSSGLVLMVNATAVNVEEGATTQALASSLSSGTSYSVAIQTQPTGETCTVASGTGTIQSANVANVVVTCADQAYSLGGSISGLNGSGLVLANGSDTLTVAAGATSFTLPTPVAYTSSYDVTVQSQPAGLACSVSNGASTMPAAAVTNIQVTCTDQPFSLGGTISGLGEYTGLVLTNSTDTPTVAAGSTRFTMPTPVAFGSAYDVSVQSSPAGLTCTASNASGTMPAANVTSVVITCSDQSYTLGGSISGLISSGLVLANGSDTLTVSSGASSFNMPTPVAYGSPYDVTVQTQPSGLTCTPSNNAGTMPAGNVTSVVITCSANTYTVGGSISGLNASGLVLLDNMGDPTPISANATQFTMNTGVAYGAGYDVTVQTEPTGLVCTVSNGSGTVGAGDVSSISIACVSNTISFTVPGAYTWTVPAGVTSISVVATGGGGGAGAVSGGGGAVVTSTLTVNPGDTLSLYVGGGGAGPQLIGGGGGGGGATTVNAGTSNQIVAGGGGGASWGYQGGGGGTPNGGAGIGNVGVGGGGGAGGGSGIGGLGGRSASGVAYFGGNGGNGNGGVGGRGGDGFGTGGAGVGAGWGGNGSSAAGGAGGGGAGYGGGGGGGGTSGSGGGGGGGGGGSTGPAGSTFSVATNAGGDGSIVITTL